MNPESIDKLIELLTLSLPYVEEGEEFNHPAKRKLSGEIRKALEEVAE